MPCPRIAERWSATKVGTIAQIIKREARRQRSLQQKHHLQFTLNIVSL
jgi:hypothetical protein